MASTAFDLSEAPADVITMVFCNMNLKQRATCALVCPDWAKAAAATTHSIVKHRVEDLTGLQEWLIKNGSQVKTIELHVNCDFKMARLPCPQLQHLLLHGNDWACRLILGSRFWTDIAAATKLTSVSLQHVHTKSQLADVVSALRALPDLQQLTWQEVQCGKSLGLSNSRLLQRLTKLTRLEVDAVSTKALQHLGSVSKLQHLNLGKPRVLQCAAVKILGLQQLTALTRLQLFYPLHGFPDSITHLTALQQLDVSAATPTELNGLQALTALTELRVVQLKRDATPVQLPALQHLDVSGPRYDDNRLHMSHMSSCTQLRRLTLRRFCLLGPDSLAVNSMLQELCLCDCSLSSAEESSLPPWQQVFPGPGRLSHLTALALSTVDPAPKQADLERMVACCSGLRRLELSGGCLPRRLTNAFVCLSRLSSLVALFLDTLDDQQCSSLAQLTGLQHLRVAYPAKLSSSGLQHLAGLQQLTRLCFWGAFDSYKVSAVLQAQLRGASQGSGCVLVNKVRAAADCKGASTLRVRTKEC